MFSSEDVVSIYQTLLMSKIQVWLTGGWGIDALLQTQTRPHKDIDVIVMLSDVERMQKLLACNNYQLKELWSENKFVISSDGVQIPTAFVLWDTKKREVDVHAIRFDENGIGIPSWNNDEGNVFNREDLGGKGTISGIVIKCISPKMQIICHRGYELPDIQKRDLELLQKEFGIK